MLAFSPSLHGLTHVRFVITLLQEYFLIPLSVGATLALLVVIAGIVLWRMKRRMVSITQSPTTERVPTPTTDFQPVPGSAYVVARPPGQKPVVIISSPGMAAFYASPVRAYPHCCHKSFFPSVILPSQSTRMS